MLVYFEERRRAGLLRSLYKVRSWYLFGIILVFRRWEQLTCNGVHATESELV